MEQQERFLPGMLDASELWCQGSVSRTRVRPRGGADGRAGGCDVDCWISGQKVWTSRAGISRWCAASCRTDREAAAHRGLSMAIVDMHAPGVTVRPLPQILNEPHFNEVFFDEARCR